MVAMGGALLLLLGAPSARAPAVTVTTIAGGAGSRRCGRPSGLRDGNARATALFDDPSRVQAVSVANDASDPSGGVAEEERLFVLDDKNGCVRSFPLHRPANATDVRSDTPCGSASVIGHNSSDVVWPNGTSRGWANLDGPQDFWVAAGATKLYLLDTDNNRLRVADGLPSGGFGPLTVLAGSGAVGSRDGGAAEASFTQPHGLSVAPSTGFAYVGDTFASCIRAVELATGRVTTVAGTCGGGSSANRGGHADAPRGVPCSQAAFNHPHKVTVDPRNESIIYVSDVECNDDGSLHMPRGRCRPTRGTFMQASFTGIRKVEMYPNGSRCAQVTTVAGFYNGSAPAGNALGFADGPVATAKFHYIHGVAIRPLDAAEAAEAAARQSQGASGSSSSSSSSSSGGSTELFAIDDFNQRVRRVDLTTHTVTTLAGKGGSGCADGDGAEATFAPVGLGVGRDGTVYVADYSNHRIRAISAAADGSEGEEGQ